MTVARVSQAVVEVLRTNTAVKARVSQAVIETARIQTGIKARVSQAVVEVLRENGTEVPLDGQTTFMFVIAT